MPETSAPPPPGWEGILAPGEMLLWQGRPDARAELSDLVSLQTAFGVVFAAIAVFWMAMTRWIAGPMPGPVALFPLFGLPFLAVGLHLAVGRIFWDAYLRRSTVYTLTTRGAYIASATFGRRRLESHAITPASPVMLEDGVPGTVWFAATPAGRIGFRRIAEAREVHRLMRGVQKAVA